MEKKLLPYLVVISALSVSACAAFYSVTGVGKMFAGSSTNVMIMMAILEMTKLILASFLYQYWDKLNFLIKSYYSIAIFTLMVITSAGIYGYLSSAYSETSNKVENIDKKVSVLDIKRVMFVEQLNDIRAEKKIIADNISDLNKGLSNNTQQYKDKTTGAILSSSSGSNRKAFETQLKSSQKRRDDISLIEVSLSDSISKIDLLKLDLETSSDISAEIGPLKYIAKITGKTTDVVVNWFIIALMLVFDPLAISLVIGANIIFKDINKEKEKLNISKDIDKKIEDFKKLESEFEEKSKDFENRTSDVEKAESNLKVKEQELDLKNKELSHKEASLLKDLKIKEDILESKFNDKKLELESDISKTKSDLNNLESKIKIDEERLSEVESELLKDKDKIKEEKKSLSNLKSELLSSKKILDDDRLDLNLEWFKLEDAKQDILKAQKDIEAAREELYILDSEIKNWESQHWKLKRNPPPSAIID